MNKQTLSRCFQGAKYGWSQDICDRAFKRDMVQKCIETYDNRKRFLGAIANAIKIGTKIAEWSFVGGDLSKCKHGADIYYDAVNSYGHMYYVRNSPDWCVKECARNMGDPKM